MLQTWPWDVHVLVPNVNKGWGRGLCSYQGDAFQRETLRFSFPPFPRFLLAERDNDRKLEEEQATSCWQHATENEHGRRRQPPWPPGSRKWILSGEERLNVIGPFRNKHIWGNLVMRLPVAAPRPGHMVDPGRRPLLVLFQEPWSRAAASPQKSEEQGGGVAKQAGRWCHHHQRLFDLSQLTLLLSYFCSCVW